MAYSGQIDWIRSFTPRLVGLSNDVISLGRVEPALTHVSRFAVIAENEAKQVSFRNILGRFAGTDPDRLQSEEYRYQTARLMVAAKKFSHPVSAQELPLAAPDANVPEPGVPLDQPAEPAEADEERVS